MNHIFRSFFLIAAAFAFVSLTAAAQVERVLPRKGASSLEGTQFVVAFMQNEVLEVRSDPRLQIFIASQHDAIVTIDYPVGPRVVRVTANSVHVEDVASNLMVTTSETAERKAIFITSDKPVVVYVLNTLATSTDTYSAIPIQHLGTQYLTMNRPNDHYKFDDFRDSSDIDDTLNRSGEFMIIATESYTNVTITPRVKTEADNPAGQPFTVTLNRGECYQVKSGFGAIGTGDLTGSRVESDRPVALLSGHMRSSIPVRDEYFKDHLIEMLPPISKWGKTYVTTPFALVEHGDFVRVMAADYGTTVEIVASGTTVYDYLASPGDFKEYVVTGPILWKADKPIFVAQFMPSSNGSFNSYDPAMVTVPPLEMYVDGALFQFPALERQTELPNQRFSYYINVAADSISLPTLKINTTLVTDLAPAMKTQRVPGTNMYWAQVKLQQSLYTISASEGVFSGVMYGMSHADSYANLFGVGYTPAPRGDHTPPLYSLALDCGVVKGTAKDTSASVPNLTEITVQTQSTYNYQWQISTPIDPNGKVEIDASIKDMWADAQIVFHAYDDKGNGKEWMYHYDAPQVSAPTTVAITSLGNTTTCVTVPIINTDTTPVTITRISIQGDVRLAITGQPLADTVLVAGDTLLLRVCYTPTSDTNTARADLVIQFPCGLNKKSAVRSQGKASINADNYDFGNVRVGDTACAMVPIYNDGSLPIPIDSLMKGIGGTVFSVWTTIPSLPVMLLPGDSIWIQVCFTPSALGPFTRTDTVASGFADDVTTTYKGRGIRPQILDVIIDMGRRKVGTYRDSAFSIRNVGEARCSVAFGPRAINDPAFVFGQPNLPQDVPGGDIAVVSMRFTPPARGTFSDTLPMITDWRFHEPIRLIVTGEGILPDVITRDIDFGNVFINDSKDSTETLVTAGGNTRLTVFAIRNIGPDAGSFSVPASLQTLTSLDIGNVVRDLVSFSPTRLGAHRCVIELDHDAIPGNNTTTSRITLLGNGIPVPFTQLQPKLIAPAVFPACAATEIQIVIDNNGSMPLVIDTVTIAMPDKQYVVTDSFPFSLNTGESRTLTVMIEPDRNSGTHIDVVVFYNDSLSAILTHDFVLDVQSPVVTSAAQLNGAPGNIVSFDVNVSSSQPRIFTESIVVKVTADRDRWAVKPDPIPVVFSDASASNQTATFTVGVLPDGALLTLDRPMTSAYDLRFAVPGEVLWRDPADTPVEFTVQQTQCANEATSNSILTVDLCAGALRMVKFDATPIVSTRVISNPVSSDLNLEFTSTASTHVNLSFLTQTGQRISIEYNYPLQKGVTNCNFSTSAWASGLYWLSVQHENGEYVVPVLFVK